MGGTAGPSALWYLTRGTGAVALVLLTLSLALGVANVQRVRTTALPRFVLDAVHRSASLIALVFLAVHIVTAVLDPFAPIRAIDAVIPFASAYRPVWLGLGAVASDVLIALVVTSLLRRRFGYRAWRATHWLAYACWPIAIVHALGTGSDARTGWMLALVAGCVLVVLVAVWIRAAAGWPANAGVRTSAVLASIAAPLALLVWLPNGPLAPGWAKRAGRPASLLPAAVASSKIQARGATTTTFTAPVSGNVTQSQLSNGLVQVDLRLKLAGQSLDTLEIHIDGESLNGGGVAMTTSRVTIGTASDPGRYTGRVTALEGTNLGARVSGRQGSLSLVAQLQIDPRSGVVTGTVTSRPGDANRGPGESNEGGR